jgi:hypothetical protein
MADQQSRTASDDVYDRELEEPRSGRRRRPVADWGVGEDMFEHVPRSHRFSRAAEGPPRDRRFTSRAADADRRSAGEPVARVQDESMPAERPLLDEPRDELDHVEDGAARDDSGRARREEPRRWTGPLRDDADEDEDEIEAETPEPPRRRAAAPPQEEVPRGGVQDGRRTVVIGKPEDVPSEIAAITADRDLGDESEEHPPEPTAERRTVRIGGRPEGSLEAARSYRDRSRRRPPRRAHERLGARPDRIAMWAFALGLLLIVIAILTAH